MPQPPTSGWVSRFRTMVRRCPKCGSTDLVLTEEGFYWKCISCQGIFSKGMVEKVEERF